MIFSRYAGQIWKKEAGKVRHLILSEQGLLSAHYAFGLIDVNGNKKPSFEVYKNLQ